MNAREEGAWARRFWTAKATLVAFAAAVAVLAFWQAVESSQPLGAARLWTKGEEMRATRTVELGERISAFDQTVFLTEGFEWVRFEDDPVTIELTSSMTPEQAAMETDLRMRSCGWSPAGGVAWARAYVHPEFELWKGCSASFALVVTASGCDGGSTVTVQVT